MLINWNPSGQYVQYLCVCSDRSLIILELPQTFKIISSTFSAFQFALRKTCGILIYKTLFALSGLFGEFENHIFLKVYSMSLKKPMFLLSLSDSCPPFWVVQNAYSAITFLKFSTLRRGGGEICPIARTFAS